MADFEVENNLNLKGNQIKNVAIEVVTSLPTTNNFVGRQVTYEGRSYIWNGSSWKNDSDYLEIEGRNYFSIVEFESNKTTYSYAYAYYYHLQLSPNTQYVATTNDENGSISSYANIYLYSGIISSLPSTGSNGVYIGRPMVVTSDADGYVTLVVKHNLSGNDGGSDGLSYMKIKSGETWLMLEKGNKATDWTPAPEDKADVNHNHDTTYLGINDKSADSDKLDGKEASDFADVDHVHDTAYLGIDATATDSDKLDGKHASDFAEDSQSINFDLSAEPNETGTKTKTANTLWQNLFNHTNFLWLKLVELFPTTQATTHNYLPKIDNANKKLVKSNIQDDGSTVKIDSPVDLNKNNINNGGFEVVTSLPTTNNFVGRQVTYKGKSYIWNGSAWKCDSDYLEIGGRNLISSLPANWQQGSFAGGTLAIVSRYQSRILITDIEVIPNTQYTINLKDGYEVWIPELDENKIGVLNTTANFISSTTFITTANTKYLYLSLRKTGAAYDSTNPEDFISPSDITDVNIKLEKGNIPTDWTPAPEDKANENQTINFDTNNIEPTQAGNVTKTSTWLWQYLTQSINYSWLKLKTWVGGLFSAGSATTNNNYLPKIDDANKKLVKSNIYDDGTTPKYGANTIWHSGNDGSNSGLDADLLDGNEASAFATSTHNHNTTYLGITATATDSDKLDGKDSTEFATKAQGTKADSAIQGVKRNGTLLTPSSNIVDVNVPTKTSDLTNDSDFLTSITKAMIEAKLTGTITSHAHNYTTSTDVSNLINTAIASVYKPKGNIANKAALLALTNIKQGDVYNAQSAFTLNGQNIKIGDNIVCLSNATNSIESNWDNLGGNIDFAAALVVALVGFSAVSGSITSSDTILSAINKLAYDKHIHGNLTALNAVSGTNSGDETTQRIGTLINAATEKTTPANGDMVGLMDSDIAANNVMKKLSWSNIKTTLKAYFDTLYAMLGFYRVLVGSTYITATKRQDTIEFVAGTNVTLTPDAVGKKVTIAASGGGGGSATYRVIGVNGSPWLNNLQGNAIHFFGTNGVQVIPYFGGSSGTDLQLEFSLNADELIAFLGILPDQTNLLESSIGVSFLHDGNIYYSTPNPICGTDESSTTISGFLTHHAYSDAFHSFTFHDIRTNIMYICSSFWDEDEQKQIWNDWKRLLTCLDSTEYVIGEESVYDYVIDRNTTEINIDPNFDPKKDIINIDITAFKNIIVANIYFKIIFNPAVPGPVTVNITNGNPKTIKYTQFYVDPASYSNSIFEIQYIIWNRNTDWLYHNRIL